MHELFELPYKLAKGLDSFSRCSRKESIPFIDKPFPQHIRPSPHERILTTIKMIAAQKS